MAQYYPGVMHTFPYSYLPLGPNHVSPMSQAPMFPPIQMHNLYSRPLALILDSNNGYNDNAAHQVEYHHMYGAHPYSYPYPWWHWPQVSPLPLYNPYANYHPYTAYQQPRWDVWPEGFTLRGELRWGRLERVVGPRRDLPEFVRDDLRRVYGTYPRTDVSITYHNGEFLVKGDPIVGEQEYRIEKRIIRKEPTPSVSETEDNSEDQKRKKKKKSKR
nr:uncharacterized protein LOC110077587 [Pogona vitticeps]XP_020646428.1 uncharacterized protein LOC110077587 [Pogona vitticeps]XP_020646429.1 uncharacterized protein LOC110077587 [Pogona vitticeps]XP_020646430.1 uncharacterized protein LOC110077587 [Pogona vitticeps]XP_020646431.1 uncharacterized protein LOC110077587 [Pogona vitticeps]XP_020646433.1 uncharacterized protein LOC110077587 [Pogona vitticeps]XP_020646434.1 uncharacterized protein LOC110077587 [Pogona vitticeps]XP_020646435.1 unc